MTFTEMIQKFAETMQAAIDANAIDGNAPEVQALVAQLGELQQAEQAVQPAAASVPETQTMSHPNPAVTALENKLATYEAQLTQLKRERATADRFDQLRTQGQKLRDAGKLMPVAYDAFFSSSVATYSAEGNTDLDKIAAQLDYCEKYASPIAFGLVTDGQPLQYSGATPSEADSDKAAEEFLNSYRLGR